MSYQKHIQEITDDVVDSLYDENYDEDYEESPDDDDDDEYTIPPENKTLTTIDIHIPGITLFYGMTNTGKSVLMKQLLYLYIRKFAQVFVFQGCLNDDWKCIPSQYIFTIDEQTDGKLKTIIEQAQALLRKKQQHTLLIIDDPFNGNAKYHNSKIWNKLSTMSRHSLISVWMSVQHPGLVPPVLKGNITGMFITKLAGDHLKKVYDYTSGFNSYLEFKTYVNDVKLGKVFYNDTRNAFGDKPYYIVDVPYPTKQFKIRYE